MPPVGQSVPLAAGLPADYVSDQELRLRLYRRIADIRDEAEIQALSTEFADRFGPAPEMVQNLFFQVRVNLRAEKMGLSSIGWEAGQVVLRYPAPTNGKNDRRLPDLGAGIRGGKGAYWATLPQGADWRTSLLETLEFIQKKRPHDCLEAKWQSIGEATARSGHQA